MSEKQCWHCLHMKITRNKEFFIQEQVNLVCDTCKRYYCPKCWTDANDEGQIGEGVRVWNYPKYDEFHHMEKCDNCLEDGYCLYDIEEGYHKDDCENCMIKKRYFNTTT